MSGGGWIEDWQKKLDEQFEKDNDSVSERRFYGTDSTDELETISEVTVEDDGTYSLDVVIVDKRDDAQ